MTGSKTHKMIAAAMFTALIAVGAFIRIPVPMVPFTLQFLFTSLAGLLLGGKLGLYSCLAYIALGLMGLPVFTQGGGIGYVLIPTFGYILGFAAGAYVGGKIARCKTQPSYRRLLTANFVNLALVYLFGMVYYYIISNFYLHSPIGIWPLLLHCFIMTVPGDIVISIAAAALAKRLIPII